MLYGIKPVKVLNLMHPWVKILTYNYKYNLQHSYITNYHTG